MAPLTVARSAGPLRPPEHLASVGRVRVSGPQSAVLKGIGIAIISGEFPGGSVLPSKDVLMRRFGVSNTPLREALQSLASKGLIAAKTRVGTWVRDATDWNMFDPDILAWRLEVGIDHAFLGKLFEVRQTLEPAAAAIAATRRTEAQVADLRTIIAAMERGKASKEDFTDADVALHLMVLAASGNPFMHSIGALIRTALAASFTSSAPTDDPARARLAVEQHAEIVQAIAARDSQKAADAMMLVIGQGWHNNGGMLDPLVGLDMRVFAMPSQASPSSTETAHTVERAVDA